VSALLEACRWCDQPENREELCQLLAARDYVGADPSTLRPALVGPLDRGHEQPVNQPDMLRFHGNDVNAPVPEDAVWILAQLARWGLCRFPDDWQAVAAQVQQRDLYRRIIEDDDLAPPGSDGSPAPIRLFGNDCLDPSDPLAYLNLHSPAAKR